MDAFKAKDVHVDNDNHLMQISWADGHQSSIPIERLRGYCPCAECQGHGGDFAWVDNKATGISEVQGVGRYALLFHFNDEHKTGIYRFEHLRKLDPAESEKWGDPENFMRG